MNQKIFETLKKLNIDAYVGYDFRGSNYIIRNVIGYQTPTTRRWVAVITQHGELHLVIPKLEESLFSEVDAIKHIYMTYNQFQEELKKLLANVKTIALDTYESNNIPVLDVIPAGFFELMKSINPNATVKSSAEIAQHVASIWGEHGYLTHKQAGNNLKQIAEEAWDLIRKNIQNNKKFTDYNIEEFILSRYKDMNMIEDHGLCIVSTNERASNPHYWPTKEENYMIEKNSVLLFDIWAKMNVENSIYADVTFMAWIGPDPVPAKVQEVWEAVRDGRNKAIDLVINNLHTGVKGFEVDRAARDHIISKGYGEYFVHRTGHSIDTADHGSGTNNDDFETHDTRALLRDTGFSIEPGIYLPEFGVRSELDMYIHQDGTPEVTTWKQEDLVII